MCAAPLTTAILAGGKSSRMGTDKAFLRVRERPVIEDLIEQLDGLGSELILITNRPESYAYLGRPMFGDVLPGKGALGGLYTALAASSQPHTLCVACDMPFVIRPFLDQLIALMHDPDTDAVVPRLAGEAEPFRAIYSHTCLGPIRAALEAGQMRVISFFSDVRVRFVDEAEIERFDPERLSFFNMNTPEELEQARRLAQQMKGS
jgi:molybdopterin-guanine dinucleotide biosynthesis protein A